MEAVVEQIRHALRKLARSPMFTIVAVLTLALGIGANAAVFSVVNGVLLRPLPFADPDRLVGVWHAAPALGFDLLNQSPALHFTYKDENEAFEDIGMWDNYSATITGVEEPAEVASMNVTHETLPILGLRPHIGRLFSAEDDSPGTPETVILAYGYWQSHFGGEEDVLGRTLIAEGRPREIIGVMQPDLQFLDYDPELIFPFRFDRGEIFLGNFSYQALARLKPGVTVEQANADVERMWPMATEKFPRGVTLEILREAQFGANVRPLHRDVVGDVGNTLWVILGTVAMVLLIACANVANLFMVRADDRSLEVALRTALGAKRGTIARDFLVESLVLAALGGIAGLGLAWAGIRYLVFLSPDGLPRLDEITVDLLVVVFTLAVSLLAGVLFGLVPVLRYAGSNLIAGLREGARGTSSSKARNRARNSLVVAQVALALVLLVGSGLMIRTFIALRSVHPGFERPEEVLTVRVAISNVEVEDPVEVVQTYELIQAKLAAIPGVTSVGASSSITMDGWDSNDPVIVEEFPTPEGEIPPLRRFKWITPGYFETMENPVIAGRSIAWSDIHDQADVVVVTENFAAEYWDSPATAIGKRVSLPAIGGLGTVHWREIVGVVGNVRDNGVDEDPETVAYWPAINRQFWDDEIQVNRFLALAIRSSRVGSSDLMDEVRATIWSVNGNLPLAYVRTLAEIQQRSMARTSFTLVMLAIAASVAMLLGAIGIYGVTSYTVSQRTREIGVRMALGARQEDVSRLVLRQGIVLAGLGVVVGFAAAVGLTRLMSALLFGVNPVDPVTYAVVAVALATIALVASYLPARRAARVNPVDALK